MTLSTVAGRQSYAEHLRLLSITLSREADQAQSHSLYGLAEALRGAQESAVSWARGLLEEDRVSPGAGE